MTTINKITVFANFCIDTEERFLRLKDSFFSINNQAINQWVINIRGSYSQEVLNFLKGELGQLLYASKLNTDDGWMQDSLKILGQVQNRYLFFWIEDHIFLGTSAKFQKFINEIHISNIDYIGYSWFGQGKFLEEFDGISMVEFETLYALTYTSNINKRRQTNALISINSYSYIISCCGVFEKEFFRKLLNIRRPILPRWSKFTPFNFEKRWDDVFILPINYGVLKSELFASIDDDNKHPGSCLISRRLYPERVERLELLKIREKSIDEQSKSFLRIYARKIPLFVSIYLLKKRIGYFFE